MSDLEYLISNKDYHLKKKQKTKKRKFKKII